MKRSFSATSFAIAVLFGTAAFSNSPESHLIAKARAFTARYHDPRTAVEDGYEPSDVCVPGMGYHYVKNSLTMDLNVSETEPEILLYADSPDGLKLVGVEYFAPALVEILPLVVVPWFAEEAPIGGFYNEAPVLFGEHMFDGPMPGHSSEMPWHYDLHAWIWEHNPDGMFSPHNPRIMCDTKK